MTTKSGSPLNTANKRKRESAFTTSGPLSEKPSYKELADSVKAFWAFFGTDVEEETPDSLKLKAYEKASDLLRRMKNTQSNKSSFICFSNQRGSSAKSLKLSQKREVEKSHVLKYATQPTRGGIMKTIKRNQPVRYTSPNGEVFYGQAAGADYFHEKSGKRFVDVYFAREAIPTICRLDRCEVPS